MATKLGPKLCNVILGWWWIYCIIGLGKPTVVDARYLPTRRSEDLESESLDKLIADALTSNGAMKKKSDDMYALAASKHNKLYGKSDDDNFDVPASTTNRVRYDRKQQQLWPLSFYLYDEKLRHSPESVPQSHRLSPRAYRSSQIYSPARDSLDSFDWLRGSALNDYDSLGYGNDLENLYSHYRYRRNTVPQMRRAKTVFN